MLHIRGDESDEVDSLSDTASKKNIGPSHPAMVDPVKEVVDGALDGHKLSISSNRSSNE